MTRCPFCQEMKVIESEVARLEWRRSCLACGFTYTLLGLDEHLDMRLFDEAGRFEHHQPSLLE